MILVHAYIRRLCRMIAGQGDTYQLAVHYVVSGRVMH